MLVVYDMGLSKDDDRYYVYDTAGRVPGRMYYERIDVLLKRYDSELVILLLSESSFSLV
jgi:hypothetical protein